MDNDKIDQHSDEIEVESEEKERGKKIEIDEDRLPSRAMAIHEHIRQDGEKELERDLSTCAQGNVSVALYRLDELEGQPIGHFNGTCIDDQDITIDNYEFTTDYLENATSGEKVVEETLVSHLLKSNCLITHQPDWGSIQIQYRGRQIDREKLLRYLVSFRHHNEFHEQCVERIFNDLLRFCQPEKLSV